jgi:RNase P subunit RPR2
MDFKDNIPTAFCKKCGNPIFNSEGTVDKKGCWTCKECSE